MIVDGDKRASSAFLEGLQSEPPSSVTPLNGRNILQVSGLEQAIAVADGDLRVRARTKSEPPADLFDTLSARTDDVAAAAIYKPYIPTPVPPPSADQTLVMAIPPPALLPSFPAPIVVLDRDLFFNPPPLPAVAPIPPRKRSLGWAAAAAIAPLATLIAIVAIFSGTASWTERPHAVQQTVAVPAPTVVEVVPLASAAPSPTLAHPAEKIMVVEVKQLKTAPPAKPRKR